MYAVKLNILFHEPANLRPNFKIFNRVAEPSKTDFKRRLKLWNTPVQFQGEPTMFEPRLKFETRLKFFQFDLVLKKLTFGHQK